MKKAVKRVDPTKRIESCLSIREMDELKKMTEGCILDNEVP